ncbi:MAG: metallophosphoesterase [bacterium]
MTILKSIRLLSNRIPLLFTVITVIHIFYIFSSGNLTGIELESGIVSSYNHIKSQNTRKYNLNGEYGLWVQERNNQIVVNWITQEPDSGYLKVFNNDNLHYDFTTPVSRSHSIAFEKLNYESLVLQYGSLKNDFDKHVTTIYLNFSEHERNYIFNKVDSIYVIGDVHGEYNNLLQLLTNGKIIDSNLKWIANRKHLVFLGDIFDRGHDVTKTLWFLYHLEKQAKKYGGYVHVVLGNHEIMTLCNDLRYLSGKENLIAKLHNIEYSKMFDIQHSILGKWLAAKPGILRINNILFAHGGVTPDYIKYFNDSIESFNDSLYAYLHADLFKYLLADSLTIASLSLTKVDSLQITRMLYFLFAEKSVFWHRGYVLTDTLKSDLEKVLKKFKSKLHVVAHTALKTIQEFYDGKIIGVDLRRPATEMLLLARKKKKKYDKIRYKINGISETLRKIQDNQ